LEHERPSADDGIENNGFVVPAYYILALPMVGGLFVMVGVLYEAWSTSRRGDQPVTPDLGRELGPPDGSFVFSPLRQRVTFAAMPAGYLIGVIGFYLAAHFKVVHPERPVSMISGPAAVLVVAAFALPALKPLRRFASVKLTLDEEGITIDNPMKTLRIGWDDVASVRWCLVPHGAAGVRPVPALEVDYRGRSAGRIVRFGPSTFALALRPAVPVATYAPSPADQQRLVDQVAIRAGRHNVPFSIDMTNPRLRVASYL
jgi:hypothetical protein